MNREELETCMRTALREADLAAEAGDVPVGACVVMDNRIISVGRNRREANGDPLAHAEIEALKEAAKVLGTWNLSGATLVVTLEPCPMCTGAALEARVSEIVFGAFDGRAGCCGTLYDLPADDRFPLRAKASGGILREECAEKLRTFFKARRENYPLY